VTPLAVPALERGGTRPVTVTDRLDVLDILRGVAVFGILLYNAGALSGYEFLPPDQQRALAWSSADREAIFLLEFLVQGKFYSLFSFLFGVGFAVFISRADARGGNAVGLFKRRLVGLLGIACVHAFLIWFGDILLVYTTLGFFLIPFVRRPDRTVLRWSVGMLLLPIALYTLLLGAIVLVGSPSGEPAGDAGLPPVLARAIEGFAHGSYLDVVRGNSLFTAANIVRRLLLMFYPRVFGMFLLGFWAGRTRVLADLASHRTLFVRTLIWGTILGLPLAWIGAIMGGSNAPRLPTLGGLAEVAAESIGTPALSLAYGAGIVLLFQRPRPRRIMLSVAPVGRTALSNYLLHSLVGVTLSYGIGFGFWGRLALVPVLACATGFFVLEMIVSRFWLSIAHYGPAEWIWRQFTYGKRFALLRV
jgi:uncharacterized protein